MKPLAIAAAIAIFAFPAIAQDESTLWYQDAEFEALSNTAMAVTGNISLSGQDGYRVITTESGTEIWLSPVEWWSSAWVAGDPEVWSGEIYSVEEDPGELENANTLCGGEDATYLVFTPIEQPGMDTVLQAAVFSGDQPENIDSPGLCGTYNYVQM